MSKCAPPLHPAFLALLLVLPQAHAATQAERLLRDLQGRDSGKRAEAAWDLGQIGAREAVPALIVALRDESRAVRANAAASLGRLEDTAAIAPLKAVLDDPHGPVVGNAVGSLRRLGVPADELAHAYRRLLGEDDCGLKLRGVRGLHGTEPPEALFPAALACDWGGADIDDRIAAGKELRRLIQHESTVPLIVDALARAGENDATTLLIGLADHRPPAAEPVVVALLDNPNPENRSAAARYLGRAGAVAAVANLASTMGGDSDAEVRESAAEALGDLGPGAVDALPALTAAASDDQWPKVRQAAISALGEMREAAAPAKDVLYEALRSPDAFTRIAARNALFRVDPDNKEEIVRLEDAAADAPPAGGASKQLYEDVSGLPEALSARVPVITELLIYPDFAIVTAPEPTARSGWGRFTYRNGAITGPDDGQAGCDKTFRVAEVDLSLVPELVDEARKRAGGNPEVSVVSLSRGVFCKKVGWQVMMSGGARASRIEFRADGKMGKVWP